MKVFVKSKNEVLVEAGGRVYSIWCGEGRALQLWASLYLEAADLDKLLKSLMVLEDGKKCS